MELLNFYHQGNWRFHFTYLYTQYDVKTLLKNNQIGGNEQSHI